MSGFVLPIFVAQFAVVREVQLSEAFSVLWLGQLVEA